MAISPVLKCTAIKYKQRPWKILFSKQTLFRNKQFVHHSFSTNIHRLSSHPMLAITHIFYIMVKNTKPKCCGVKRTILSLAFHTCKANIWFQVISHDHFGCQKNAMKESKTPVDNRTNQTITITMIILHIGSVKLY